MFREPSLTPPAIDRLWGSRDRMGVASKHLLSVGRVLLLSQNPQNGRGYYSAFAHKPLYSAERDRSPLDSEHILLLE